MLIQLLLAWLYTQGLMVRFYATMHQSQHLPLALWASLGCVVAAAVSWLVGRA